MDVVFVFHSSPKAKTAVVFLSMFACTIVFSVNKIFHKLLNGLQRNFQKIFIGSTSAADLLLMPNPNQDQDSHHS